MNYCAIIENPESYTQLECLEKAHGGSQFHRGATVTYNNLNRMFPGHGIPFAVVADYVRNCAICAKVRLGLAITHVPIPRHLQVPFDTRAVGWDNITMTPADDEGFQECSTFVDLTTKLTALYRRPNKSSESLVENIWQFFSTYGPYHVIHSDPGSDIMSAAVAQLNAWLGCDHRVSLVDRHESSGVENTNGRIQRYLQTMMAEKDIKHRWSSPSVLGAVQFYLNDIVNSETGLRPFEATFGTVIGGQSALPQTSVPAPILSRTLESHNRDLLLLKELSFKHKHILVEQRRGLHTESQQNKFQKGDFVVYKIDRMTD
jgi:hypothetical protein